MNLDRMIDLGETPIHVAVSNDCLTLMRAARFIAFFLTVTQVTADLLEPEKFLRRGPSLQATLAKSHGTLPWSIKLDQSQTNPQINFLSLGRGSIHFLNSVFVELDNNGTDELTVDDNGPFIHAGQPRDFFRKPYEHRIEDREQEDFPRTYAYMEERAPPVHDHNETTVHPHAFIASYSSYPPLIVDSVPAFSVEISGAALEVLPVDGNAFATTPTSNRTGDCFVPSNIRNHIWKGKTQ